MNVTTLQYIQLHNSSRIKPGDKVKVIRIPGDNEKGWQGLSTEEMTVSEKFVNVDFKERGFMLSDGRLYPFFVLRKL